MKKLVTCYRCSLPMVPQPEPLDLSWVTHPVKGLENHRQLFESLNGAKGAIKVYCEIAE